jgi:serine/threonine-protein kinase
MDPDALELSRALADLTSPERDMYYTAHHVPDAVRTEVESILGGRGSALPGFETSATSAPAAIGRYQVVRLIGRGGMGDVYLARDPVLERDVAVKLIRGELETAWSHERLVREARAVARLRHPNIVTVFDAGEFGDRFFIAMEVVRGETLGSLIRRQAPLSLARRLELIEGACAGLAHAHREGVVHFDIKPDNLMLDDSGVVKVLDFGIARVLKSAALVTRQLGGTLRYMSPEQIEGRPLDRRSDVFSLGCAFFELVTFVPAFVGSTKDIVTQISCGPMPRLLDAIPNLEPRLDAIARRAMAIDPARRYPDLDEFRADVAAVRHSLDPGYDPRVAPPPVVDTDEDAPTVLVSTDRGGSSANRAAGARRRRVIAVGLLFTGLLAAAALWIRRPEVPAPAPTPIEAPPAASPRAAPAASDSTAASPAPAPEAPAETSAPPSAGRDDVWRLLALGDRDGVIRALQSGASGNTRDSRLASDVLATVRASVLQVRQQVGASIGSTSTSAYASAEEEMNRATRLSQLGQPLDAIGALWRATDLYSRVAIERRSSPGASEPTLPRSSPVAADRPNETARPPAPPPPQPQAAEPRGGRVAAGTEPPVPDASPAGERSRPDGSLEMEAVRATLARYEAAYRALDVTGLLAVYPALEPDQAEQLRRTFSAVSSYDVEVRSPQIDVQGETAIVRAELARRISPRVGNPVSSTLAAEFTLRRDGGVWVITGVATR